MRIEDAFFLDERLSAEYAPTKYEFINFACAMMSPADVLLSLRERALAYAPDLIVVSATSGLLPYYLLDPRQPGTPRLRHFRWPPPGIRARFEEGRPRFRSVSPHAAEGPAHKAANATGADGAAPFRPRQDSVPE